MMALSTVQNAEVGRVYLVRRQINGALAKRFEPALIKARWFHEGSMDTFAGWRLNVKWVTDGTETLNLMEVDGTVKELTKRWLTIEIERASAELSAATKKHNGLLALKLRGEIGMDDYSDWVEARSQD
jgi:hypothetical protein